MTAPTNVEFTANVTAITAAWVNGINDWVYPAYNAGTFVFNGATVTFAGTNGTTITFPSTTGTLAKAGTNGDITSLTACTALTNTAGIDIKGTNTNDDAAAGYVGEYVESIQAPSTTGLTTVTAENVTSLALTAGDWDVFGQVELSPAGTTSVKYLRGGISQTTATFPSTYGITVHEFSTTTVPTTNPRITVPVTRVSLAGASTVFLVADASFTVSTAGVGGRISARRVR